MNKFTKFIILMRKNQIFKHDQRKRFLHLSNKDYFTNTIVFATIYIMTKKYQITYQFRVSISPRIKLIYYKKKLILCVWSLYIYNKYLQKSVIESTHLAS